MFHLLLVIILLPFYMVWWIFKLIFGFILWGFALFAGLLGMIFGANKKY